MPESEDNIDRRADESIKRIERGLFLDGKLDKSIAAEGAGILLLPPLLGAAGLVCWILKSAGLEGAEMILFGVPLLIAGVFAFLRLAHGKEPSQ